MPCEELMYVRTLAKKPKGINGIGTRVSGNRPDSGGLSDPTTCPKANKSNYEKLGRDFNQSGHLSKMELKSFGPSLWY